MSQKPEPSDLAEQHARSIRRVARCRYSAKEKIRIVLSGRRGEHSFAEPWRKYRGSSHAPISIAPRRRPCKLVQNSCSSRLASIP